LLYHTPHPALYDWWVLQVQVYQADLDAWIADAAAPLPSLAERSGTRTVKLFCLNDYLGLSAHPAVREAAASAARLYGSGPRSSPLAGGYTCYHRDLELALADLKSTEDCLLFPTGFAANLAVASAAGTLRDKLTIFSDELNHASIVDGVRMARHSGATVHVYRHSDMVHLEQLLADCPLGQCKLVITDSLFSMDGDFADLQQLAVLKARHDFLLAVDEAHATLVCGATGGGATEMAGVEAVVDLHVGTLSKAFGCLGGFVACSRQWKELLVNKGRTQVFSTALPVPIVAAAQAALKAAADEPWRRARVWALAARVGVALDVQAESPIIPIQLGTEVATVQASAGLLRRGVYVPAIRPPTVPVGTSRLRVSLSAGHSDADVVELIAGIQAVSAAGAPLHGGDRTAATETAARL
jgi:8-amino-7-oxononanoate synthase